MTETALVISASSDPRGLPGLAYCYFPTGGTTLGRRIPARQAHFRITLPVAASLLIAVFLWDPVWSALVLAFAFGHVALALRAVTARPRPLVLAMRMTYMRPQTAQLVGGFVPARRRSILNGCLSVETEAAVATALDRMDELCADIHATPISDRNDHRIFELTDLSLKILEVERRNGSAAIREAARVTKERAALAEHNVTGEVLSALDQAMAADKLQGQ